MKKLKAENRKYKTFKDEYDDLKTNIITNIWFCVYNQVNHTLDMTDHRETVVLQSWDDNQISETIDELVILGADLISISSCSEYNIEGEENNLKDFEIPQLLNILRVVEDIIQPTIIRIT